jgi:hypothetical protein
VWKVPTAGGEAVQVTKNGGAMAVESADGRFIYYLKEPPTKLVGPLWKMPVEGGEESEVLKSIHTINFAVFEQGIYFIPEKGPEDWTVQFLSFATGKVTEVARIAEQDGWAFSVSPDERRILFSKAINQGCSLMLVENFH